MPPLNHSLGSRFAGFFGGYPAPSLPLPLASITLGLLFCILVLVLSCGGDFPLNDDWAYGDSVRVFLSSGRFYMPTACAPGFAHILWGALYTRIFGFSYVVLRFSVLLAGAIGAWFAYLALRELGARRSESLLGTLVYAANPIMVNLYLGFMSDVPALSLSAIYFLCFFAGLKRRSLKLLAIALTILLVAITIRQSVVILALAAPAFLFSRFGSSKRRFFLTAIWLILPIITFWLVDSWMLGRTASGALIVNDYGAARSGHGVFFEAFLHTPLQQCLKSVSAIGVVACYLGLFTAPISLAVLAASIAASFAGTLKNRKAFWTFATVPIVAGLLLCLISAYYQSAILHAMMPYCENILRFTSVGAQGLMGIANPILTPRQKIRLTIFSYLFAWLLLTQLLGFLFVLLRHGKRVMKAKKRSLGLPPGRVFSAQSLAVLFFAVLSFAFITVETMVRCTDRYYLIALLPTIVTLIFCARLTKIHMASPFAWLLVLPFDWYGLAAGQDYLSSNAARWQALTLLEKNGVQASSIDGGAEYNVSRDMNLYASHYRGSPPRNTWRWWPVKGEDYIVSFSPIPDYDEISRQNYFSCLTMSEHSVYVLKSMKLNK